MNEPTPNPITGTWQLVRAEFNGEQAPELVTTKTQLTFTMEHYVVRYAGEITDRGSFESGPIGTVQTVVLRGTQGPNTGRSIPCLYQVVGDRLRVCFGLNGTLPTAFTTAANQGRYLATYRRKQ